MASRLELHETLCEILGSRNVYNQPPSSSKMKYPCIRYSINKIEGIHANNSIYKLSNAYEVILIDTNIESEFVEKLMKLPMCKFDRFYLADGLYHWVFTIYI